MMCSRVIVDPPGSGCWTFSGAGLICRTNTRRCCRCASNWRPLSAIVAQRSLPTVSAGSTSFPAVLYTCCRSIHRLLVVTGSPLTTVPRPYICPNSDVSILHRLQDAYLVTEIETGRVGSTLGDWCETGWPHNIDFFGVF